MHHGWRDRGGYLYDNLGFGLTWTMVVTGVLLALLLVFQFRSDRYVPPVYWLAVVFISVFGTLITDNLTDRFNVSLIISTIVFAVALAATFAAWYRSEHTLSIHSIVTTRREAFLAGWAWAPRGRATSFSRASSPWSSS